MEGLGAASGKGDDEECANVLNVRIWLEGAVLEYEPCWVAKTPWKILTAYRHAGGANRCGYKGKFCVGKSMRETFEGGPMQRRLLMCWLKAQER